ncbi:DEAD/DEAH box helicase [Halomicroarcula sp. GCM10025709]|uniref:DEAD/DEAH box helicase n=1 Tax=Halomicroarcula sp. GCM10025709 TaxID=3252669 RepID=UPI0036165E63
MDNPAQRANEAVSAYRNHFIGRAGPAARSVANRQAQVPGGDNHLLNTRGPFLQALNIPNWSDDSWAEFSSQVGLHPLIQKAFSDLGFRRLYDFQERSIRAIKDGNDTVVTAATGRGKTEAWLLPILDRILEKKRQGTDEGTTATLIYPTKALAQDQFKRLVQYLYQINKQWPATQQITIGIYDGDTPTNTGSRAHGYLESSFKYFDCPGANEDLEKCRHCGQGVHIHHGGQQYELRPEKRQCVDDVPLDFIRLTKEAILQDGVDILLTNPDTINMKLVNVNAPDEHETFIYDPDFLVFDEVHTYDGLFGSYTATLTKRLRALRAKRDCDDLQVIASSATVENDVELFRRISNSEEICHVDENPQTIDQELPASVPDSLIETELTEADLLAFARGTRTPPALDSVGFDIDPTAHDNERLLELLQDALFDAFTNNPGAVEQTIRYLHTELSAEPQTPADFKQNLQTTFGLTDAESSRLLENFTLLGTFSGLLENRTHLFSWPIDGFYACAGCDAVYTSPQEECRSCGYGFVTRSAYCNRCDDEALIAWYCPSCEQLDQYVPNEGGERERSNEHICQRCSATSGKEVQSLRVTFQPILECTSCGERSVRTTKGSCPACPADLVHTSPDELTCPNPACETTVTYDAGCSLCGGEQEPLSGTGTVDCSGCGRSYDGTIPDYCECGRSLTQTRLVPWVCRKDACERVHFGDPPDTCPCGSHTFARRGCSRSFPNSTADRVRRVRLEHPTVSVIQKLLVRDLNHTNPIRHSNLMGRLGLQAVFLLLLPVRIKVSTMIQTAVTTN